MNIYSEIKSFNLKTKTIMKYQRAGQTCYLKGNETDQKTRSLQIDQTLGDGQLSGAYSTKLS